MLKVTGPESTSECQDEHIFAVHKEGVNGAVYGVKYIWDNKSTKEYWGFLLVYAKNVFNDINQIKMLWTVCHLWLSGALFVLNCYTHWSLVFLRKGNVTFSFMHSREGVTQGDPLAMIA